MRVWTSARLIVLSSAPCRMGMTISAPGSSKNTARIAEESSTARSSNLIRLEPARAASGLIARDFLFFAALGDQFVRGENSGLGELGDLALNPANASTVGLNAQHSILDLHQNRLPGLESHLLPDCGRN